MPELLRSKRSHEESVSRKQTEEQRVWMEKLEGRILLSAADELPGLDLSVVNHLTGSGTAMYRLEPKVGQTYLILDEVNDEQIRLLDSHKREINVMKEGYAGFVARGVWAPNTPGPYYLSIGEGLSGIDYDVFVRTAHDDYGNGPSGAGILSEGQTIHGEIEDYLDRDIFAFDAVGGERYAFGDLGEVYLTIRDQRGRTVMECLGGCQPMPYTGRYYAQVDGHDFSVGTYDLRLDHVVDDSTGDASGAKPLTIGTETSGTIDYSNDYDWFVFRAVRGTVYEFGLDAYFTIYDQDGNDLQPVYDDWRFGYNDRQEWVAPADGFYYLEVSDGQPHTYTISSAIQQVANPSAGGVSTPIALDVLGHYSIDTANQSRYLSFQAQKGATYYFQPELSDQVKISIVGSNGELLKNDLGAWSAPAAGTYYLWARNIVIGATPTFTLGMYEEPDDFGNSAPEAAATAVGSVVNGAVQYKGDSDWFEYELVGGERYVFNLDAESSPPPQGPWRRRKNGPTAMLTLSVVDGSGQTVAQWSKVPWLDLKKEWVAPDSGKYYVCLSYNYDREGYSLSLATVQTDPTPAKAAAVGETLNGLLEVTYKTTRYRIQLEAGNNYVLKNRPDYLATSLEPVDDQIKQPARWVWVPQLHGDEIQVLETGWYFLSLYTYDIDQTPMAYSLDLEEYVPPPPPPPPPPVEEPPTDKESPAKSVTEEHTPQLPFEMADENDVRGFSFIASAGKFYSFRTVLGTLEDSTVTIYDQNGEAVADNDDVSEDDLSSLIEWTAEKSGIYFIVVGGFGEGSFDLSAFEGKAENRHKLKLEPLGVPDARARFGYDSSNDEEDDEDNGNDDGWLSDDYEELNFSNEDWGNL